MRAQTKAEPLQTQSTMPPTKQQHQQQQPIQQSPGRCKGVLQMAPNPMVENIRINSMTVNGSTVQQINSKLKAAVLQDVVLIHVHDEVAPLIPKTKERLVQMMLSMLQYWET